MQCNNCTECKIKPNEEGLFSISELTDSINGLKKRLLEGLSSEKEKCAIAQLNKFKESKIYIKQ